MIILSLSLSLSLSHQMKRSPPIRLLSAATTDDMAMSSRPPYRGGRCVGPRGVSIRPYNAERGQFVSGDSHFQSVREANFRSRQGDRGNFARNRPPFQQPPPPYNQDQQYHRKPPPPYYQNQQFRPPHAYPRQPPPFDQNQALPPPRQQHQSRQPRRQKPLDYRNWEIAKTAPPTNSERFVVLSYNILADYLAIRHHDLYCHLPPHMLDWEWRKRNILFELRLWSADIMCFQEVDRFQDIDEELKLQGYSGIWKMRTGTPVDGCAIFWRTSRFKLIHEECIEFNKLGLRDNVAQIFVLELLSHNNAKDTVALPTSSGGSRKVVVCNIHVLYNPKRGEIKLGQVRVLLDKAHSVSKCWNNAPVVLCGDFNCTPKSPLYNFISEQKLDLSCLDRDKVSGQASAEIRALRPHNPNPGLAPSLVESKEVGIKLNDSNINVQCGNEDSALCDEVTKETKQALTDGSNGETRYVLTNTIDNSEESSCIFLSEDGFPVDQVNDEIHKFTSPIVSCPEDIYSNLSIKEHGENVTSTSHSNQVSLREHSYLHNYAENESTNCDISSLSHEVSPPGVSGYPSSQSIASDVKGSTSSPLAINVLCASANIDLDEKLESPFLDEVGKASTEGRSIGEDDSSFLSALHHHSEDACPDNFGQVIRSDLDHSPKDFSSAPHNPLLHSPNNEALDDFSPDLNSEAVNMEKTTYDPSLWTPMEIATATGNAGCTFLEHPLKLKSSYTEVEDCSGTRDSSGEPMVTSYNGRFLGTVDYIWRSEGLQTIRALAPIPKHAMTWTQGFPTRKWGSDHIALASELVFTNDSQL
ncbi:Exo_endo_phos domain-containing protein [Cephalotus follicularis]|uniref:Exo_endo_phos domain-containing protein n=1 Tax=Cephalotus follicularis TaxID=3775 RepID=A0A1Q3BRQ0_CEPFO|nr:Exo_endo_phos domain-containing protein [Cephalotus follicularis]